MFQKTVITGFMRQEIYMERKIILGPCSLLKYTPNLFEMFFNISKNKVTLKDGLLEKSFMLNLK